MKSLKRLQGGEIGKEKNLCWPWLLQQTKGIYWTRVDRRVWRDQAAIFWNSSQHQCPGTTADTSRLILKFQTAAFPVLQVYSTSSAWEAKQNQTKQKENIKKSSLQLLASFHLLSWDPYVQIPCHDFDIQEFFPRLDHLQCPSHLLSSGVVESLTLLILATTPAACLHLPCASPSSASAQPSCETDVHWLALPLHSGRETGFDRQRGSRTSLASLKSPSIVNPLSTPHCKATVCPLFWLLSKSNADKFIWKYWKQKLL